MWTPNQFSLSVFSHDRWMLALTSWYICFTKSLLDFLIFNFDASWFSYIYEKAILHLVTMSIVVYDQHIQYVCIYHVSSLRDEPIWTKLCRNIITSIWTSTCLKKQNKSNSPVVGIEMYMFISHATVFMRTYVNNNTLLKELLEMQRLSQKSLLNK